MSGQEMYEHIQQLARDLDVPVWVCLGCDNNDDEPWGQAVRFHSDDGLLVVLTRPPDEPDAYITALHELGHHVDGWGGLRLDREAGAWRWALETALPGVKTTPSVWAVIHSALSSYARDRRFKRTPTFDGLLAEAERNARG